MKLFSLFLFLFFLFAGLWQRDYNVNFVPHGPASGTLYISHPLKSDKFINLKWAYDPAYQEKGWCAWGALPGKAAKFHLVYVPDDDYDTLRHVPDEWWKD